MTARGTCARCGFLVSLDSIGRVGRHRRLTSLTEWCTEQGRKPLEDRYVVPPARPLRGAC